MTSSIKPAVPERIVRIKTARTLSVVVAPPERIEETLLRLRLKLLRLKLKLLGGWLRGSPGASPRLIGIAFRVISEGITVALALVRVAVPAPIRVLARDEAIFGVVDFPIGAAAEMLQESSLTSLGHPVAGGKIDPQVNEVTPGLRGRRCEQRSRDLRPHRLND